MALLDQVEKYKNLLVSGINQSLSSPVGQSLTSFGKAFAQAPAQFGNTIGKAVTSPLDLYFANKNSQIYQNLQNNSLQSSKIAQQKGNMSVARNLAAKADSAGQKSGQILQEFGQNAQQNKKAVLPNAVRTGLTLLSGSAGLPSLTGNAVIGGGLNALLGDKNQTMAQRFGQGAGESLKYTGLNKAFSPVWAKLPITPTNSLGKGVLAGAQNVAEQAAYTKATENRNMTKGEFATNALLPILSELGGGFISKALNGKLPEKNVKVNPDNFIIDDNGKFHDPISGRWASSPKDIEIAKQNQIKAAGNSGVIDPKDKLIEIEPNKWVLKSTLQKYNSSLETPDIKIENAPIKVTPVEKYKELLASPASAGKERGLVSSVGEAPKVGEPTKSLVEGTYEPKPNEQLMGEAQALLKEGASIDFKHTKGLDQKVTATIQQAVNLDQSGQHEAAAALFNNLSEHATELGRGVQAFSLLDKMSPEAISLSAAGKIRKYNATHNAKIPELTGEQQKLISDQVNNIRSMADGREKNIALNELGKTINSFIPSSIADKAITIWKAGLLTSLRTTARNLVGNTIHGAAEVLKDPFATVADQTMSLRTGQRTLTPTLNGLQEFGSTGTRQQIADIVSKGYDPSESISHFDIKQVNWKNNPLEQAAKIYTDIVFRTLGAQDKPFYNAAYARSLYDQAGAAALNAGMKGNRDFVKNLVQNATPEMITNALKDADTATFHNKNAASAVANAIKKQLNNPKLGAVGSELGKIASEVVLPFTGVPSAIAGQIIAYSPAGLLNGIKDTGKVLAKNIPELQRQAAQEIGRGVVGTGLWGIGAYLMSQGLMTGQPKDSKESAQWKLEGKQPNSVLIGGKWRSIGSIGPENLVMLAGGKAQQELGPQGGGIGALAGGTAKDFLSQTFLQGMMGPLNAIQDPARYGKSYVGSTVSSGIPNIVKDISKGLDPNARETNTTGDYLKSGIPGLRNTLLPKRDALGNIIPQTPSGVGAFVDLFNSSTPTHSPVIDELGRLNDIGENSTPAPIGKNQTIQGKKMVLTPEQVNQVEAAAGPKVQQALGILFKSPNYQSLNDQEKSKAIGNVISSVKKQVMGTIDLSQNLPDLGYAHSSDAPNGTLPTLSLYGKSLITNPKDTLGAVVSGNPIRKLTGDAVVLERKNGLGILDNGDKTTQVDHKIALALGGKNEISNLQALSNQDNALKGRVEVYLMKELQSGRINQKEAQQRDLNWKNELKNIGASEAVSAITKVKPVYKPNPNLQFQIINQDTGSVKNIDLSKPIVKPEKTGVVELDKKLLSSYNTSLTSRANDVVALFRDGQITKEQAGSMLETIKSTQTSNKKPKKISVKKVTFKKLKVVKLPRYKKVTVKKIPNLKLTSLKTNKVTPVKIRV